MIRSTRRRGAIVVPAAALALVLGIAGADAALSRDCERVVRRRR